MHKFDSWGYNERNEDVLDILPNKYQQKTVLKEYKDKADGKIGKCVGHAFQVRQKESVENFALSAYCGVNIVFSPVKHVIAPEYFYRPKEIIIEHPLYQPGKAVL